MPPVAPVDQRRRILMLRLSALAMLPLVILARPVWLDTLAAGALEQVGALMIVAGVLGRFWSILYIGGQKNARVVREGPYSMCRHPLYLFSTVAIAGFALMLQSVVLAILLVGTTFSILWMTARREEVYLLSAFGAEYADYMARVPRILPDPGLFRTDAEVTFSVATLRRNFADSLVFLALIPLAEGLESMHAATLLPLVPIY